MSGSSPDKVVTFKTTVVIPQKYVFVVVDTGQGTCRLPTSAGDLRLQLGIVQQTAAKVNTAVAVAVDGESYLKCAGVIARGARITSSVAGGKEGWGIALVAPVAPGNAAGGGTNAEVDAVRDHAIALFDFEDKCSARATEEAAGADGDLITVHIGNKLAA